MGCGIDCDKFETDQLVQSLVDAYGTAVDKVMRTQILSFLVDIFSLPELQRLLPHVNAYKFHQARLRFGFGQSATQKTHYRVRMSLTKVDHFITFISSPHLIQDVAYGTRTLRLSSGEKLLVPNVVRTMISSRLIKQYEEYCREVEFEPVSSRELFRILQLYPAQQRKSLQGLDNTIAEGFCVIEPLEEIAGQLKKKGVASN